MRKFIQIHSLAGYSGILNRDNAGLAKRISFGNAVRLRVSSQCLKYAWRHSDGKDSIQGFANADHDSRTRVLVEAMAEQIARDGIKGQLVEKGMLGKVSNVFIEAIYGEKASDIKKRQALLFSLVEMRFIAGKMAECLASDDPVKAATAFKNDYKAIMKQMRQQTQLPHGLIAALFGRMVTSDTAANIDAAIHVAHSFSVHADRSELDYFAAVDDLLDDDQRGAAYLGDSEISNSLFYGYTVIDTEALLDNLGGNREYGMEITRRLVRMIASVSPGAKRGSTAPYSYASTLLVEVGDAQPRSLAEAYQTAVQANHAEAEKAMERHLRRLDEIYETGEDRAWLSLRNEADFPGERGGLSHVSEFASRVFLGA